MAVFYVMVCALPVLCGIAAGWDLSQNRPWWFVFWTALGIAAFLVALTSRDAFIAW